MVKSPREMSVNVNNLATPSIPCCFGARFLWCSSYGWANEKQMMYYMKQGEGGGRVVAFLCGAWVGGRREVGRKEGRKEGKAT
jgi:hypothetical protein